MRQVVLDTETTGLDWERGHRIIEIGCVEMVNRRQTGNTFHCYVNPEREVDEGAQEVHGLSSKDLADKPLFRDIAESFLDFVDGTELIMHNAPFDVGFLDNELRLAAMESRVIGPTGQVLDTLTLARQIHPGQRNSLDALCKRYGVDNSRRDLHGALLDSLLLAEVYLAMTGGQAALSLGDASDGNSQAHSEKIRRVDRTGIDLMIVHPSEEEIQEHNAQLDLIEKASSGNSVWRRTDS